MTFAIEVVDWSDPRALALRDAMNAETGAMYAEFTAARTPEEVAAIDAALTVDPWTIVYTVIATEDGVPLGHSALRPFGEKLEVKKVFTTAEARGKGVAKALLADLERYALKHGVTSLVLQTGPLQVAAIELYLKLGYVPIPVFGDYEVIAGALCYEKQLAR
ncbi:MAG: GNAT family N-acetyltransferase [Rhodoglobus sp.]